MDPSHAAKADNQPRLFRLGELTARAGARQRREQAVGRLASDGKEEPAADPAGVLFQTQGDLCIGEVMNLTGSPAQPFIADRWNWWRRARWCAEVKAEPAATTHFGT